MQTVGTSILLWSIFSGYCILSVFQCRLNKEQFTALLGHVIMYCALNFGSLLAHGGG
jgi:hypothetical protein